MLFRSWEATKHALASANSFIANFATQGITLPCLLYEVNSNGSFQPRLTAGAIKDMSAAVSKDLSTVMNEVHSLLSEFNHHWDQVDQASTLLGNIYWISQETSVTFRAMLWKGNHRSAPGPNGWEK